MLEINTIRIKNRRISIILMKIHIMPLLNLNSKIRFRLLFVSKHIKTTIGYTNSGYLQVTENVEL